MKRKIVLLFLLMGLVAQVFAYKKLNINEHARNNATYTVYFNPGEYNEKSIRKFYEDQAKVFANSHEFKANSIWSVILKSGASPVQILLLEYYGTTEIYYLLGVNIDREKVFENEYNDFNSARADYDYLVNKYLKQIF